MEVAACPGRRLQPVVLLMVLAAIPALASGTQYEGSPCFHEASQMRGVCKMLPYCSWAVKERRSELYPQACAFVGYMPVVCCPYTRTHDPPHLPLRPLRPYRPGDAVPADPDASPDAPDAPHASSALTMAPAGLSSEPQVPTETAGRRPLRPLEPGIGGVLGPLPVPSSHAGAPGAPDDLQQDLDGWIADDNSPQLGDGSGAFFLVRSPRLREQAGQA